MIVIMDMASGERTVDDSGREPSAAVEMPSAALVVPRLALREVSRDTPPPPVWGDPTLELPRHAARLLRH
jgi:hypothetical protein